MLSLEAMGQRKAQLQTELDDLTQQRNDIVVRKMQLSQEMEKLDQERVAVDTSITLLKRSMQKEGKEEIDAKEKKINEDDEYRFVWQWFDQGGDDCGIPKRYTPCRYFFKSGGCTGVALGCNRPECEFSHDPIFYEEPFHSCL